MAANGTKARLRTLDMTYIALFAVLMAVCAWIAVPAAVPFTLQTFGVFFTLLTLGGRRGGLAIVTYLLMGAVGLPVFTGFQGGLGVLLGTTGGYLVGFLLMALIYRAVTALGPDSIKLGVLGCVLGLAGCYAFGTAWFLVAYARQSGAVGLGTALGMCVVPFLLPDAAKLTLAVWSAKRVKKYLRA